MNFREVLGTTQSVVRKASWLRSEHEITLVRDLAGRMRVVIGTREVAKACLPDSGDEIALTAALQSALGSWVSSNPLWIDREKERDKPRAMAVRLVRKLRQSLDQATAGDPHWYLVERHAAKRTWVGEVQPDPPWPISEVDLGHKPPFITFFSHKGGVGRTTALAATAIHWAREGRRVALVDLDLEAPGLGSLFLVSPLLIGTVDFLVEAGMGGATRAREVTSFVSASDIVADGEGLQIVPCGSVDDVFLEMLARLDLQDAAAASVLANRLRELFEQLLRDFGPLDAVLVDARAGLHEVAGLMLAGLTHGAVVVGTHSPQSWIGVQRVAKLLSAPWVKSGKDPLGLVLVHGMAPMANDPGKATEEASFRTHAYDLLSEHYYPKHDIPQPGDEQREHWPVVVPWQPELRGAGGLLTRDTVALLLGAPYRNLAERLEKTFAMSKKAKATT